jgi:hypothetical protein
MGHLDQFDNEELLFRGDVTINMGADIDLLRAGISVHNPDGGDDLTPDFTRFFNDVAIDGGDGGADEIDVHHSRSTEFVKEGFPELDNWEKIVYESATIWDITSQEGGDVALGDPVDVTIELSEEVFLTGGVLRVTFNNGFSVDLTPAEVDGNRFLSFNVTFNDPEAVINGLDVVEIRAVGGDLIDSSGFLADLFILEGRSLADNADIDIVP